MKIGHRSWELVHLLNLAQVVTATAATLSAKQVVKQHVILATKKAIAYVAH